MKILKNRKGLDFAVLLVLAVIVSTLYLGYQIVKEKEEFQLAVGASATGVYKAFQEAEKVLLFVDMSALFSVNKAVYKLGEKGGFKEENCGIYDEYYLWNKINNPKELCDKNIIDGFAWQVNKEMNSYLKDYGGIPQDNYDFFISGDEVYGFATENINFDIWLPKNIVKYDIFGISIFEYPIGSASLGRYSAKPSFNVKLKNNFDEYKILEENAEKIIAECAYKFEKFSEKEKCVKENSAGMKILSKDENIFLFEHASKFKSDFEGKNAVIRFALIIPHENVES